MSVAKAVERDLEALERSVPGIADTTEAASARVLARDMDDSSTSPTQRAGSSKALAEVMAKLRSMAPASAARDAVDDVARKRAQRRAKAAS